MINKHKWINSLPKTNIEFNEKENQVDHSRWVNTIPQKNTYNSDTTYKSAAKEYLNTNYVSYKKNQIKNIDNDNAHAIPKLDNTNNKLTKKIQLEMIKKIKRKKTEIRKLQELYSKPESIPGEIKTQVAIKIKEKKTQ